MLHFLTHWETKATKVSCVTGNGSHFSKSKFVSSFKSSAWVGYYFDNLKCRGLWRRTLESVSQRQLQARTCCGILSIPAVMKSHPQCWMFQELMFLENSNYTRLPVKIGHGVKFGLCWELQGNDELSSIHIVGIPQLMTDLRFLVPFSL